MERDFVKRYVTKDGKQRVSIYQSEYASNPREWTDEPFHCEDWSRNYSIMEKSDYEYKSDSARKLLEYMLKNYGDYTKIIDVLVENGKNIGNKKVACGTALLYDRSRKTWLLLGDINCYFGSKREDGWYEYNELDGRKYDLDFYSIIEESTDDTIDYLVEHCMTDGVKMMSYGFGYYGGLSFYDEVTCDAEGICWLEKDEFLKYSGNGEDYWKDKSLKDIEFLIEELGAWSENEVYFFKVEKAVKKIICTRYPNGEQDDTEEEITDWEEMDSCGGYYGELDKIEKYILGDAGFKKDELEEVA